MIIGVIAAIAFPSYNAYVRRAVAAQAMQEMQKLAEQLERHKSRNFSYRNFNASYLYEGRQNNVNVTSQSFSNTNATVTTPLNVTGSKIAYTLYIRDAANPTLTLNAANATGKNWVILAEANSNLNGCVTCNSLQDKNFSFLLSSTGIKCKTQLALNVKSALTVENLQSNTPCGAGSENW